MKVRELINEYSDVFSSPEQEIGKTNLIEFDIKIEDGARAFKSKLHPLNPDQKKSLKAQIELWKKEDVIEESDSPWALALVPVIKKDSTLRWAVDYSQLNSVTIKDAYPLPNISENLDKLQGSKIFSNLDPAGAYHTIPVKSEAKTMLAFTMPFGFYTFKRMPFGPTNSGQVYSRFMQMVVDKLRSPYVLAYIDDIINHTLDMETHLEHLR